MPCNWFLIGFCCLENVRLTWDIFGPVDEVDQLPLSQFDQRVQKVDLCGWLPMVVVALQHGQRRLVQGLEDSHCLRLPGRLQIEAKVKRLKKKKPNSKEKLTQDETVPLSQLVRMLTARSMRGEQITNICLSCSYHFSHISVN